MFHGKEIHPLGFSRRGELIGERASSEVGPLASPQGSTARAWAAPPGGEPGSLPPLRLIFGLREASVKIAGSAFVSSNSENISYVTFETQK
jgi:hypothetical protein